jgi:hypothetical protein
LQISTKAENVQLTDLKASQREIIACDTKGRVFRTDLLQESVLKPLEGMGGLEHRLGKVSYLSAIGRAMYIFKKQVVSIVESKVLFDNKLEFETLVANTVKIQLMDREDKKFCVDPNLHSFRPIVCINNDPS